MCVCFPLLGSKGILSLTYVLFFFRGGVSSGGRRCKILGLRKGLVPSKNRISTGWGRKTNANGFLFGAILVARRLLRSWQSRWLWIKNRYPKWNPISKWKQGLNSAVRLVVFSLTSVPRSVPREVVSPRPDSAREVADFGLARYCLGGKGLPATDIGTRPGCAKSGGRGRLNHRWEVWQYPCFRE